MGNLQSIGISAMTNSSGCQVQASAGRCQGFLLEQRPNNTPIVSTPWFGERAKDEGFPALQAVKCRQGRCQGFLLEQRPNNTRIVSTPWFGERAKDEVFPALQAVKCRQGRCQGLLLEQRPNNITDGQHWVCTACARSVPSHPPSGSSSLCPRASDTSVVYPEALQNMFKRLWNKAVDISNQKVRHSLRLRSCWIICHA